MNTNTYRIAKSRFLAMDALKGLAIYLVLCGHCIQQALHSNYYDEPVFRWIYSIHMPLFMIISGFFASGVLTRNLKSLILNKGRQLLLPVVIWCVLIDIVEGFIGIQRPLTEKFIYMFWFLKSLFICFVLFYIGLKYLKPKYRILGAVITLIISQFINYYQVSFMYPCFLAGYYIKENFEYFGRNILPIGVVCLFIYAITSYACEYIYSEGIFCDLYTGANMIESYLLLKILRGISGSISFISLFCILENNDKITKALEPIAIVGSMTLSIYILQTTILEMWIGPSLNFDDSPFILFNFIIAPLISLAVLIVCVFLTKLIRLNKYAALILIGEKPTPAKRVPRYEIN